MYISICIESLSEYASSDTNILYFLYMVEMHAYSTVNIYLGSFRILRPNTKINTYKR